MAREEDGGAEGGFGKNTRETDRPEPRPRRTAERWLALVAIALGALALLGDPYGGGSVRIDARELAAIVEAKVDHVTTPELADWILRQRSDYRLIDLRSPEIYAEYHIPTAENAPLTELLDYPLTRNEKIVLYSDGGIHAAQAWFLLRAKGFRGATTLLGGLDAWKDDILFPTRPPEGADAAARAEFAKRAELSRFFGGTPRAFTAEGGGFEAIGADAAAMPKVEPPVLPPGSSLGGLPVAPAKKKRKEGC